MQTKLVRIQQSTSRIKGRKKIYRQARQKNAAGNSPQEKSRWRETSSRVSVYIRALECIRVRPGKKGGEQRKRGWIEADALGPRQRSSFSRHWPGKYRAWRVSGEARERMRKIKGREREWELIVFPEMPRRMFFFRFVVPLGYTRAMRDTCRIRSDLGIWILVEVILMYWGLFLWEAFRVSRISGCWTRRFAKVEFRVVGSSQM